MRITVHSLLWVMQDLYIINRYFVVFKDPKLGEL